MSTLVDELLLFIFDNHDDELANQIGVWLAESRRFRSFVDINREKIRKKLRVAQDVEARRDLGRELETAYWLADERSFVVEYEKHGAGRRGPDFSVRFRTHHVFNVEVKRIRGADRVTRPDGIAQEPSKIANVVCDALGQMSAGEPNVVVLFVEGGTLRPGDVQAAMRLLKERVERKDEEFFIRHGYRNARDFVKYYLRLSGIVVRGSERDGSAGSTELWANAEARRPIPRELTRILQIAAT